MYVYSVYQDQTSYRRVHWCSAITQYTYVRNENSNTQGSSPNVVKVIFHTLIWEQILSFKRCYNFEKGRNCIESLPVFPDSLRTFPFTVGIL